MEHEILIAGLKRILATRPAVGLNPEAKMSDPDDVKVCWNVHKMALDTLKQYDEARAHTATGQ